MPSFTRFDESSMSRALQCAEQAAALASPNPRVGCVLTRREISLAEGAHVYDRFDHAEIVALKSAEAHGVDVRGATAYVTLEPCSHHGRTGPCADALIAAGIARCFVATVDPNPQVSGRGIDRMREAGITVEVGLLEARARTLNNAFALSITQQRPYVTLKAALSVDGMLAPPPALRDATTAPFWLTGSEARAEVQRLRHRSDAILTGIGTVLADDPLLTDRTGEARRRPLLRVILDSRLRIPIRAKLLRTAVESAAQDLWIFCGPEASASRRAELARLDVKITEVSATEGLNLREVLAHLHEARIVSVLIEGGSALNRAFLGDDLVDEAILFYAETELGPAAIPFATGTAGPFALEQKMLAVTKRSVGPDVCVSGLLHDPWKSVSHFE